MNVRPSRAGVVAFGCLLGLVGVTPSARADDANKGAAEAFFEQGRALVMDKKFEEACPKFAESLRLDPGIGTMLWLADCYENVGKTASAWALFKEAAATATLRQDSRAALARSRATDLEAKIPKILLIPPSGPLVGLELHRDGVVLGAVELGVPVPVNPGVHVFSATAEGRKAWSTTITVLDSPDTTTLNVPPLELAPQAVVRIAAPVPTRPAWGNRQTLAAASAGVGLVAVGLGSYFGLHAKSTYDAWKDGGGVDASENSSAYTQATLSTILFGAGIAAIAGGALLYLTAPRGAGGSSTALVPVASPRGGGMWLSRTF